MLRVIVIGLGPIGLACAQAIRAERDLRLVGLVDLDPAKIGKTLDQIAEQPAGSPASPQIVSSIHQAVADAGGADVAMLTTSSDFEAVAPSLRECLASKLAVVSSCERMAWPWYRYADLAKQIDAEAQAAGRAMLGTGVNPGFVMDFLSLVLASQVRRVTRVRCERRVEAGLRRKPLQAKVGATMKPEKFRELAAQAKIGHEGMPESIAMIAAGLGRRAAPGSIQVALEPVIADKPTPSALGLVEPGMVAGIHNTGRWSGDGLTVELDLTMAVGTPDPGDRIILEGPVQLTLHIPGGLPGDSATVAALVNHVHVVHAAKPGLRTMLDVPIAGCAGRDA
jgi:4-hydroxy-tetrahydrodipicolinate reductase